MRLLPAWLRSYDRAWLPVDVMAGLTVWALMVPQALAYAGIAGVPVQNGLYVMPLAVVGYLLLGSSRHLYVGPSATVATLSASTVALVATASTGSADYIALTCALTLMVGVIYIAGGLARMGFVSRFFARPVLEGFIVGLGLYIAIGQVPKVVGIAKPSGDTLAVLAKTIDDVGKWEWTTVAVGVAGLVALFAFARFAPKLPGVIIVVALAILASDALDLQHHGVAIVGDVPTGFHFVSLSSVSANDLVKMLPGALAIVIVGLAQALAIAKSYAAKYHYAVDANREMLGYGAANLGAGALQGYTVTGGLSASGSGRAQRREVAGRLPRERADGAADDPLPRRVVRRPAGAGPRRGRDLGGVGDDQPRAGHAVPARAVTRVLGGARRPARRGPHRHPSRRRDRRRAQLHPADPHDRPPAHRLLGRSSDGARFSDLEDDPGATPIPGVLIHRFEAELIFANADLFQDDLLARVRAAEPPPGTVVLDFEAVSQVDVTGAQALRVGPRHPRRARDPADRRARQEHACATRCVAAGPSTSSARTTSRRASTAPSSHRGVARRSGHRGRPVAGRLAG